MSEQPGRSRRPGAPHDKTRCAGVHAFRQQPCARSAHCRDEIAKEGAKALFVEPGSPWENGHNDNSKDKLSDELLNVELVNDLGKTKALIER